MQALLAALALILSAPDADGGAATPSAPIAQPDKPATPPAKEPESTEKQPEKAPPPSQTPPQTPPQPPSDPATEDILKEMQKETVNAPPPVPSTAPPVTDELPRTSVPITRPGRLLREGTFLVDRRGRMVRQPSGDWTYTFDADAQGQADPAMTLLPCQKLEAMEKLAERYGESLTLVVTGQVFAYKNRNYLLPATFRVVRQNPDIKSTQ